MSAIFIYVTASNADEAHRIGRALVEDRLAACVNILPAIQSIYHWQGEITETSEAILIVKSRATLFSAIETRIKEMHSYSNPCIISLPIEAGSQNFLGWILQETMP